MHKAIPDRAFRADLYYRLAFLTIQTPPLKERGNDIELLATHFLDEVTQDAGMRRLKLTKEALLALGDYSWPGNVRELRSIVFQAALGCEGVSIRPQDLKIPLDNARAMSERHGEPHREILDKHPGSPPAHSGLGTLKSARDQSEKRNLEYALERNASNITRTAQDLGVSRMTLYRLMAKHGVARSAPD